MPNKDGTPQWFARVVGDVLIVAGSRLAQTATLRADEVSTRTARVDACIDERITPHARTGDDVQTGHAAIEGEQRSLDISDGSI